MSEEAGIPAATVEHVSLDESGNIRLSEEAMAVMDGVELPKVAEPKVETAPPVVDAPAQAEARKIKWNGQEVEVRPEQEVELLQKGYNYDQQMARIESERAKLAAYGGLVQAIEASPDIRLKVAQALGYQQEAPQAAPQFDDPIEQIKWEAKQEAVKEVNDRLIAPLQQQQAQLAKSQQLQAAYQSVAGDPYYHAVNEAMRKFVSELPVALQKPTFDQLNENPDAYLDMYRRERGRLIATQPKTEPQAEVPPPTKRETKAPILESTSSAPDAETLKAERAYIKDLEKRSRNGDFRAIGELMSIMA